MKVYKGLLAMALLSASIGSQAIDLSTANYVTYGDGQSYSLPLNGFNVKGSCGQISMMTKLGLQCNGQQSNGQAGMDDAYLTPSANTDDSFSTTVDPDPNGIEGAWDKADSWDATLAALDTQLDLTNNSMVFFFANNETGAEITDNLAAWARITIEDLGTNSTLGMWDLTNDGGGYGTINEPFPTGIGGGTFFGDPGAYTSDGSDPEVSDFLRSGGNVCINDLGLVTDCDNPFDYWNDGSDPLDHIVIDEEHNLGSNEAAYAVIFPELDDYIAGLISGGKDLSQYAMHVDFRLGCAINGFPTVSQGSNTECDPDYALNGGAEKVWIGTQDSIVRVPVPATLALFGLGLLGLAAVRSRRT